MKELMTPCLRKEKLTDYDKYLMQGVYESNPSHTSFASSWNTDKQSNSSEVMSETDNELKEISVRFATPRLV